MWLAEWWSKQDISTSAITFQIQYYNWPCRKKHTPLSQSSLRCGLMSRWQAESMIVSLYYITIKLKCGRMCISMPRVMILSWVELNWSADRLESQTSCPIPPISPGDWNVLGLCAVPEIIQHLITSHESCCILILLGGLSCSSSAE